MCFKITNNAGFTSDIFISTDDVRSIANDGCFEHNIVIRVTA